MEVTSMSTPLTTARPSDDLGLHRLRRAAVAVIPAATTALVALLIAEVLCHLRLEGGLQHGARDLAEQPTRPDQRHALSSGLVDQLLGDPYLQPRCGPPVRSHLFLSRLTHDLQDSPPS
jgi:hypothetical protein